MKMRLALLTCGMCIATAVGTVAGPAGAQSTTDTDKKTQNTATPKSNASKTTVPKTDAQNTPTPKSSAAPTSAPSAATAKFSDEDLQKLVAPIALYPDAVLAHVLPASTVPLDIVEAARYLREHNDEVDESPDVPWLPSVRALLRFPTVIHKMDENLTWTRQLGEAVVAQQADVMDAIQHQRKLAEEAGSLESNEKQTIVDNQDVIEIVPADPEVIYVPQYDPAVVYVEEPSADYYYTSGALGFTAGVIVGAAFADDDLDWYGHGIWHGGYYGWGDIDIDVDHPWAWRPGPGGVFDPRGRYDPRGRFDPRGPFDPRGRYDPRGPYDPRNPRPQPLTGATSRTPGGGPRVDDARRTTAGTRDAAQRRTPTATTRDAAQRRTPTATARDVTERRGPTATTQDVTRGPRAGSRTTTTPARPQAVGQRQPSSWQTVSPPRSTTSQSRGYVSAPSSRGSFGTISPGASSSRASSRGATSIGSSRSFSGSRGFSGGGGRGGFSGGGRGGGGRGGRR